MDDPTLNSHLNPGETLVAVEGVHGFVLILPAFFLVMGAVQFTPWAFAQGTRMPGLVFLAYGAFTWVLFWALYRHGRLALTNQRLFFLQKNLGRPADISAWGPGDFDLVKVRQGAFGKYLGFGHLMLYKGGRLVTVVRTIRKLENLAVQVRSNMLGQH